MILPVSFLWRQLNGPQVTAISQAVYEYWKNIFDTKLNYFNNISIDTANDDHLTLLGLLSGLVRPVVSEADREYFYFTEDAEHGSSHGFSDLDQPGSGGRLTALGVGQGVHNVSLNEDHYRALLRAFVNGEGEIGSLQLLDDICAELTRLDLGQGTTPFYRFNIMDETSVPGQRSPGDVFVDIGTLDDWHNPTHIYAVLKGVANAAYSPQPQLYVSIDTSSMCADPTSSVEPGEISSPLMTLTDATIGARVYYKVYSGDTVVKSGDVSSGTQISIASAKGTYKLELIAKREFFGDSHTISYTYKYI